MSEVARRWGPETAAREPSIEDLLEPIALEARLAEARARRTQVLAAKYGNPALVASAPPPAALTPAARALPLELPLFFTGLAAGTIAAALGLFWIIDPFAAPPTVASAPQVVVTVSHDVPQPPAADLLPARLPLVTSDFLRGAPAVAPVVSTDFPQAPALSAPPGEAADAASVDDGLRPISRVRAGLLPAIMGQPLVLLRERVPTYPALETPTASDTPTAIPRAPVSCAAIRPASAVIPSLVFVLPAAARELPAAARELPLSNDGPTYVPPMLCYPAPCYSAILGYTSPAKPAPAPPMAKAPRLPVAPPAGQPPASAPATPVAGLPGTPENPPLAEVPALPAAPSQPVAEVPALPAAPSQPSPRCRPPRPRRGSPSPTCRP